MSLLDIDVDRVCSQYYDIMLMVILGDVNDHLPSVCLSMVMVVKLSGEIAFYSPWYINYSGWR